MSIGFAFRAQVRHRQGLVRLARELAFQKGYGITVEAGRIQFRLCPMGEMALHLEWVGDARGVWRVWGQCFTTPAGPGFHQAALQLLEELSRVCRQLQVDDETGFWQHRDFERMRQEHFDPWAGRLVEVCRQQQAADSGLLYLCWDTAHYTPRPIPGTVITPLGRFSLGVLEQGIQKKGPAWWAEQLFIWNHAEKDAYYHRNRALNLLWEHCRFVPSSRSLADARCHGTIIEALERAAALQPSLPLPRQAYAQICALAGRPGHLPPGPEMDTPFPIGYRRDEVTYRFGSLSLPLPGSYLYEWEEQDEGGNGLWQDIGGNGPVWRICGLQKKEGLAQLDPAFQQKGLRDIRTRCWEGGQAQWGWRPLGSGAARYQLVGEVVHEADLYWIFVDYSQKSMRDDLYQRMERIDV